MPSFISPEQWANFENIIYNAHQTFNTGIITWVRGRKNTARFNEEEPDALEAIDLNFLAGYNYFRTWPLTKQTNEGELDNQNMVIYINKRYLQELGYINPRGYFEYNPDLDYFILNGIRYKSEGDTDLSQTYSGQLHVLVILKREEVATGNERADVPTSLPIIAEISTDTMYLTTHDLYAI